VSVFTADGAFLYTWGTKGSGNGQFNDPKGIAVDPQGYIYVADTANHRIQKFGPTVNVASTSWGRIKALFLLAQHRSVS
jgi:DNA-binding beta-propeller fold protein YncE